MRSSFMLEFDRATQNAFNGALSAKLNAGSDKLEDLSKDKHYLGLIEKNKVSNPILALDYFIEYLKTHTPEKNINVSNEILILVYNSCQTDINDRKLRCNFSWDKLFSDNFWHTLNQQKSFSYIMLYLISFEVERYINCSNIDARINHLFQNLLSDDLVKYVGIKSSNQTFKEIQQWRDYLNRLKIGWEKSHLDDAGNIKANKQMLYKNFATLQKHYTIFIHFEGITQFCDSLYDLIAQFEEFLEDGNIYNAEIELKKILEIYSRVIMYDNYIKRITIIPILISLHETFSSKIKEIKKPAIISLTPLEKRYPFFDPEASITLTLIMKCEGGGYAYNLDVLIEFGDNLQTAPGSSVYSDHIIQRAPGIFDIEIPVKVKEPINESVIAIVDLSWTDGMGMPHSFSGDEQLLLEFKCENKRVNWESFKSTSPYSTKPVQKDEDYFGRETRLQPLINDIKTNLTSSWLYGQRRIGKTSTILGIQRELIKDAEFLVAMTTYGDFSHDNPKIMIDQMVKDLVKKFNLGNNYNIHAPEPNGSLAPLKDYLWEAHQKTNKKLFFMIDEFDELPLDFYAPNNISQPFWQTLRSISTTPYAGFLLVGGENVKRLKTTWGGSLNLLRTHRADRFLQEEFLNYTLLVRNPVKHELEITDDAIQYIFRLTQGNPFFTKLLCIVIQRESCRTHNSFITERDIERYVEVAINNELEMDHFQHFIEDGVKDESAKRELQIKLRAKFLHALSKTQRSNAYAKLDLFIKATEAAGIDHDGFKRLNREFIQREIIEERSTIVSLTMPLFQQFLASRGDIELPRFFRASEEYEEFQQEQERFKVTSEELQLLSEEWGVYQGRVITAASIRDWLNQFEELRDRRRVFDLLKKIRFIKKDDLVDVLKYAFKIATSGLTEVLNKRQRKRDDVYVSYLDGPGKSGAWVANEFKVINQILNNRFIELEAIKFGSKEEVNKFENMKALVLVDDFACTGNNVLDLLKNITDTIRIYGNKFGVKIVLFVAYGFETARDSILRYIKNNDLPIEVHFGDCFTTREKIFSSDSRYFDDDIEKKHLETLLVAHYGESIDKKNPRGYQQSEVAIIFPQNCPNNSLPIFWKSKDTQGFSWKPLFPRLKN